MRPGMDCISCHASGEGPAFTAAGTVYSDYHQEDDCYGEPGVTVEITDADGAVFTAESNDAGNFYFRPGDAVIQPPYTARLLVAGVETNAMVGEQTDPNCAACHTADGANAAPGRIVNP